LQDSDCRARAPAPYAGSLLPPWDSVIHTVIIYLVASQFSDVVM